MIPMQQKIPQLNSLLTLKDLDAKQIFSLIACAKQMKKSPQSYQKKLKGKTLLMIFEKPSLRTRISFDVAMTSLGGSVISIDTAALPLGKKESIEDTAKVVSRYVDVIVARLYAHDALCRLQKYATIPVINGLTDDYHPIQIVSDLLTISEKKRTFQGLKLCYVGDACNNVTHSLLLGCAHMGITIAVGCPKDAMPKPEIVADAKVLAKKSGAQIILTQDAKTAAKDADIIYADSWMSYQIDPKQFQERKRKFMPYQVNSTLARYAKKDYLFMNCLPAQRGMEQTAEIIDGPHSIVFDQAENRLHMQKAVLLAVLKK